MSEFDYSELENLVKAENYEAAEIFCRAALVAGRTRSSVLGNTAWLHLLFKRDR